VAIEAPATSAGVANRPRNRSAVLPLSRIAPEEPKLRICCVTRQDPEGPVGLWHIALTKVQLLSGAWQVNLTTRGGESSIDKTQAADALRSGVFRRCPPVPQPRALEHNTQSPAAANLSLSAGDRGSLP
jgi:hypothetical protein